MNFQIINFAMKLGCHVDGADEGFDILASSSWFEKSMIEVKHVPINHKPSSLNSIDVTIMEAARRHQEIVLNSLKNQDFPCSFGGDHTCGIGGTSAALEYYNDDVTIIWLDAHADTHTPKTSPSKHIHGMPCAILQDLCDAPLNQSTYPLKPERLVYVGLNSFEDEEMNHIKNNNIAMLTANLIRSQEHNITLDWIRSSIKTKYVYLSFDFDVLSKDEFFAVNVNMDETYTNPLGLSLSDVHSIMSMLFREYKVVGCDVVEYNPRLDPKHNDLPKVIQTLEHIVNLVKEDANDKTTI